MVERRECLEKRFRCTEKQRSSCETKIEGLSKKRRSDGFQGAAGEVFHNFGGKKLAVSFKNVIQYVIVCEWVSE